MLLRISKPISQKGITGWDCQVSKSMCWSSNATESTSGTLTSAWSFWWTKNWYVFLRYVRDFEYIGGHNYIIVLLMSMMWKQTRSK